MTSPPQINPLVITPPVSVPPNRQQINNSSQATNSARPNLLQNGGMEQWHWKTPVTVTNVGSSVSGIFGPDKWMISGVGNDSITATRDTTNQDSGTACVALAFTLGSGSAQSSSMNQLLPQADAQYLRGQTVTLAVRVKCSTAGAVRATLYNGAGGAWTNSPTHTGNGQYQTLVVTDTLQVMPTQSWPNYQFGVNFLASCTAYVDSITLVVGTIMSDYSPPTAYPDVLPGERVGPDLLRLNLLTNGGFENWQRGNGPFAVGGVMTADRWQTAAAGGDALSVQRDTNNVDTGPGGDRYAGGSQAAMAFTLSYSAGGGSSGIYQQLRIPDGHQIAGRMFCHSMRVRTAAPNAIKVNLFSDGATNPVAQSSFHTGDGTWQTLTAVLVVPGNATYVAAGINVYASGVYYLDNASVVSGQSPSDYQPPSPADDLLRCQRYYEIWNQSGEQLAAGMNYSASACIAVLVYKTQKPVVPNFSMVAPTGLWYYNAGAAGASWANPGVDSVNIRTARFNNGGGTGLVAGNANIVWIGAAGTSVICEANP